VLLFIYGCGECIETYRSAAELLNDNSEVFAIYLVQPKTIYLHAVQRVAGYFESDRSVKEHFSYISNSSEQPVRYSGSAASAAGYLFRALFLDARIQNNCRPLDDRAKVVFRVEI